MVGRARPKYTHENLITLANIRLAIIISLALASAFGVLSPNEATKLRNDILVPLDVIQPGAVDLL